MHDVILISIPETKIKNIVEQAVKKALSEHPSFHTISNSKLVLNFEEGIKYLGISKSHGYRLTSSSKIPHSKRGKRIYFDKSELDEWLLSNKIKTADQINFEADYFIGKRSLKR